VLFVIALATPARAEHSNSTVPLLAIDARPSGNTATELGRLDGCTSVEPGGLVTVDYITTGIPHDRPLIAFQVAIQYNHRLLEAVAVDNHFLLASEGEFHPFTFLSDDLPDSDGELNIAVVDFASSTFPEANVESGRGVLSRVTFRARMRGASTLSIGFHTHPDLLYPLLQDTQNETILVSSLGRAWVVIGRDCPKALQKPLITAPPPIGRISERIGVHTAR
jgi:hypothetical protein